MAVESWQVLDYTSLTVENLFRRLSQASIPLSQKEFREIAGSLDSPEELSEVLTLDDPKYKKMVYLIVFELWKRFPELPETLSIFCDKFDGILFAYDKNPKEMGECVQSHFIELSEILESNMAQGGRPKPLFAYISRYFAADLETYLYRYIYDQIEWDNDIIASKILGRFYEFVREKEWFDFLRLKLLQGVPPEDATAMVARFLEGLKAKPNVELSLEILRYFLQTGHIEPFLEIYKDVANIIKREEDFREMLDLIYQFYALNDRKEEENSIRAFILKRKNFPKERRVSKQERIHLTQIATP